MRLKSPKIIGVLLALVTVFSLVGVLVTPAGAVAPIGVTTNAASTITYTGATLSGAVTTLGTGGVNTASFNISTDPNLAGAINVGAAVIAAPGTFTAAAGVLLPNTTYYFQAQVNDTALTTTGAIRSFVTTSYVKITPQYVTAAGAITIEVNDSGAPALAAPAAKVTVSSANLGDSQDVILLGTGIATGKFTGTLNVAVAAAAVASNGTLEVKKTDRIEVKYDPANPLTPTAGAKQASASFDAEAPIATIASATYSGGIITVSLGGTEVNVTPAGGAAGVVFDPTQQTTTAGDESGVYRIDTSINGGPYTVAWVQSAAASFAGKTIFVPAPTQGTYVITAKAYDLAGNVTGATDIAANKAVVIVDTVSPIISAATYTRSDAGTDADATKVAKNRYITINATVNEAGSGVPIVVHWTGSKIDEAGGANVFVPGAPPTGDPIAVANGAALASASGVKLDTTNIGGAAGLAMSLSPTDPALAPIAAALAAGPSLAGNYSTAAVGVIQGLAPAGAALNFFSTQKVTVGPGTFAITVKVTDANGNASTTSTINVTVVADTTPPVLTNAVATPPLGFEVMVGETLATSLSVSSDIAGMGATGVAAGTAAVSESNLFAAAVGSGVTVDATAIGLGATVALTQQTSSGSYNSTWKVGAGLTVAAGTTTGAKTLTFTATDNAGNVATTTVTVTVVTQRTGITINLATGWTLISVPKALVSSFVPDVFKDITTVTKVQTYQNGQWVSAAYDPTAKQWDGSGGLVDIVPGQGYFVSSSAASILTVKFKADDATAAPATYTEKAGWNLIGFVSPTVSKNQAVTSYLASLSPNWLALYTYPTDIAKPTVGFSLAGNALGVNIGQGYWLYTSADGVLVP